MAVKNLEPAEVARGMKENKVVLVDVREPHEHEAECIEGAILLPLSQFDPRHLPEAAGKSVVLHCGSGMRSAKAIAACESAGVAVDSHVRGGIQAWKAAGLPTKPGRTK
ncbi:MAG: rhodanese-like domain-containing protein [Alphaproteobacteria bacterium]|nr:rhodanese-like domain-containing protein [Alphaproteobacteria bacterium]